MILPMLLSVALAAPISHPADMTGLWRNASNSVHIRTDRCGRAMCGTIVWASAEARQDAARGGPDRLIGTRIFDQFEPDGDEWVGDVYVPDLDQSFSGTLRLEGRDTLVGRGCLFGNFGCREQRWTRMPARPTRR